MALCQESNSEKPILFCVFWLSTGIAARKAGKITDKQRKKQKSVSGGKDGKSMKIALFLLLGILLGGILGVFTMCLFQVNRD